MTLIVFDAGLRTTTPWYDIFPPKDVEQLEQLKASRRVEKHEERSPEEEPSGHLPERKPAKTAIYESIDKPAVPSPAVKRARDIMTTQVTTLDKRASVNAAWQLFQNQQFRHIPIIDNEELVGIVSDRDILSRTSSIMPNLHPAHLGDPLHTIMTKQVLAGHPDTEIRLIASVFKDNHISAMPIIDNDNKLAGIVTRTDILDTLIQRVSFDIWS